MDAYSTSPNVRTSSSRCTYIGDVCKTNKTAKSNNTPAITETAGRQAGRQAGDFTRSGGVDDDPPGDRHVAADTRG
jgi:hypothetical protein